MLQLPRYYLNSIVFLVNTGISLYIFLYLAYRDGIDNYTGAVLLKVGVIHTPFIALF